MVEFGTRRAHSPEAGVLGARAAFLGGCAGNQQHAGGTALRNPRDGHLGALLGDVVLGEREAFRQLQRVLGDSTIQLIDTYDTLEGARRAANWAGHCGACASIAAISMLLRARSAPSSMRRASPAPIMASGDLDEYRIRELLAAGAPIDAFGVGTQLSTSADAPSMSAIYKFVELDIRGIKRFTAKYSEGKPPPPAPSRFFATWRAT